ncbi:transketolase [Anoxybacter fermentans]|uniref:Transketolase n=1 Tax=Anoxybacter fermentans TaxID=1323375 RepID=A0A3Q9HP21_9FIRM|nr:transketolase family protein [Anoxybacter fermentans]AZR72200.1 transketolase [Anoxybacter fermentans]
MAGKATRDGFGDGIVEAGRKNSNIVVLDADVGSSTRVKKFMEEFPERFLEMGIAEANMIGVAAGLATCGKIPFASTFAVFASARVADQLRNSIAYPKLNVKIAATHAGITVGPDGATHQAVEDIAILRSIPNFTVIVPCDYYEAKEAVKAAAEYDGPVYLRFTRGAVPFVFDENYKFEWGKVVPLRDGQDVTIFATGVMVDQALKAAQILEKEGISAHVVNVHTIKPLDVEGVVEAAQKTGAVVTAEEHNIYGGLGSAIAEVLVENAPMPMQRVGIKDTFGESGKPDELMKKYGLLDVNIVDAVHTVLKRK